MKNKNIYTILTIIAVVILIGININSFKNSLNSSKIITKEKDTLISIATSSNELISATSTKNASTTASSTKKIYLYTFKGFGKNDHGQLTGPLSTITAQKNYTIKSQYDISKLFAGKGHSLAITKDSEVISWGLNTLGQLGYKTKEDYTNVPNKIEELKDITALSSTNNHTLAVNKAGEVYAWGLNFTGQLGNGNRVNTTIPQLVKGLPTISRVAAGHKFSLASTAGGDVYAWGAFCDTSASTRSKALLAAMGSNIVGLQGGYYDNASNSNTKYDMDQDCLNEEQIKIKSLTPVKLPVKSIIQMSIGYGHALLLTSTGKVIAFGCNLYGQLGNEPGQKKGQWMKTIDELEDIKQVAAGARHSLFLKKDGSVYATGADFKGQLADNTSVNRGKVAKIEGLPPIKEIYTGFDYSVAVAKDGTVWVWGINNDNFLKSNLPGTIDFPMQVDIKNPRQIATGGMYIMFKD